MNKEEIVCEKIIQACKALEDLGEDKIRTVIQLQESKIYYEVKIRELSEIEAEQMINSKKTREIETK